LTDSTIVVKTGERQLMQTVQPEQKEQRSQGYLNWFPLFVLGALFSGIVFAPWYSNRAANSCDGDPQSSTIKHVTGPIAVYRGSFYIPDPRGNWILFKCARRCSPPLEPTFSASIGKQAQAAFCQNQVLWVDIEGQRILTKDHSASSVATVALAIFGPLILISGLLWLADPKGLRWP